MVLGKTSTFQRFDAFDVHVGDIAFLVDLMGAVVEIRELVSVNILSEE